MAAAEARIFHFPRNDDAIKSQNMPLVTPGWVNLTSRHWDLPHSPIVPHFDHGVPALPVGVPSNHPQIRDYYAYVERLEPFYPAAIAMFLLIELKKSVGDDERFARYKAIIDGGFEHGDFDLE